MNKSKNRIRYASCTSLVSTKEFVVNKSPNPRPKRRSFSVIKRKRDANEEDDNLSVLSLDISLISNENKGKIRKRLSTVSSFASLLAPALSKRKKIESPVQEEIEGWDEISNASHKQPLKQLHSNNLVDSPVSVNAKSSALGRNHCNSPAPIFTPPRQSRQTPKQRRSSRLWLESLPIPILQHVKDNLSKREIRRQEALFELYQGEEDMVDDLELVQKIYHDSLMRLGILTPSELKTIFGPFHGLLPLHQALVSKWETLKGEGNSVESVGELLQDWVPGLKVYVSYCANQIMSRALLDVKKSNDPRLNDFLQRCLESPFSRRLDLWSFLDVPRSRLVKYPLLLKSILKHTPDDNPDTKILPLVISQIETIIKEVDAKTGEAKCQHVLKDLDFGFSEDRKDSSFILKAKTMLCSGILRNTRGTKLQAFLFDTGFVLTRPITKWRSSSTGNSVASTIYHVYRDPIPATLLEVVDLKDGEVRIGGSFRNAFSSGTTAKNLIRVSCRSETGASYSLQANDEHDKKQWLQCLLQISNLDLPKSITSVNNNGDGECEVQRSENASSPKIIEDICENKDVQ